MKNKCAYYIYPNIRPFDYSIQTLLIYSGLLGWGIAEAFYGNLQLYGFYTSNNMLYRITGSFENPGPYAGFLAAILPLAVYAALQSSGKNTLSGKALSVLAWINIFLTATILPATMPDTRRLLYVSHNTTEQPVHENTLVLLELQSLSFLSFYLPFKTKNPG